MLTYWGACNILCRMKTSIRLDDDLLTKAKLYAAMTGKTFTAVVEEALREMLARRVVQAERPRVSLTTVKGRGVRPGIDLDDSASLLDKMEELDVSS